jgi:hypothetical protein
MIGADLPGGAVHSPRCAHKARSVVLSGIRGRNILLITEFTTGDFLVV